MARAVFPFPGGKSHLASWILDHVPDHECFVEVFGGAAGVLVNKDPDASTVEVYNDRDGDIVQFFEVLRDQSDELTEWLDTVPYSRAIHGDWAHTFYHGYRPSDPIERAGQFFFLRYAQWGGGYDSQNGFGTSKVSNSATSYQNKIDRLSEFADRFGDVVVENLDWHDVLSKYDSAETVFYLDPPYVGKEDYYLVNTIDHDALVTALGELDGRFVLSYSDLPESLAVEDYHLVERGSKNFMNSGKQGSAKDTRERLVMNIDPETVE
jgi:DNA adenine methylase